MKIPDNRNPYEVIINGVKKTYGAGETVADDAAVKQIIDDGELFPLWAVGVAYSVGERVQYDGKLY